MARTLLTEVENHRTNLMVVLAGYKAGGMVCESCCLLVLPINMQEKMGRLMRAEDAWVEMGRHLKPLTAG